MPESDIQFLAKMIVATREGHQIPGADAQRLNNLATFGDSLPRGDQSSTTTMPEERRGGSRPLTPSGARDVVRG
jgi:hypothetical protein